MEDLNDPNLPYIFSHMEIMNAKTYFQQQNQNSSQEVILGAVDSQAMDFENGGGNYTLS